MQRWLPALLMVLLLVGFRILGAWMPQTFPNFQPLVAMFLCGAVYFTGRQRYLVPALAWVLTDPFVSLLQQRPILGWHHLGIIFGLAITLVIAQRIGRQASLVRLLGGATLSAIAFYFCTNLVAFAADALYPKTLTGFIQAQWTGPVGYSPTWLFLRNLLAANLLFTGVYAVAFRSLLPKPLSRPSLATR